MLENTGVVSVDFDSLRGGAVPFFLYLPYWNGAVHSAGSPYRIMQNQDLVLCSVSLSNGETFFLDKGGAVSALRIT